MSNELTPAEVIAVKLFGWEPIETPTGFNRQLRWYDSPTEMIMVGVDQHGIAKTINTNWPDFTDERLAWYWIDLVQRELAARGLIYGTPAKPSYIRELRRIYGTDDGDAMVYLLATVPQRLEAAIRVIEESGL
jgi:hypothetical protein